MLTQVYELLITQLHIFIINFINVLSNYRCIRYLVFPALFPSICMVCIDYRCIREQYIQPYYYIYKFTLLMKNTGLPTMKRLGKFVSEAFSLRKSLLNNS